MCNYWIFPSRVERTYWKADLLKGETDWHVNINVALGDVVYFYIAKPISRILYRGIITKIWHAENGERGKYIIIGQLRENLSPCLSWKEIKSYYRNNIQGPMHQKEELIDYCEKVFNGEINRPLNSLPFVQPTITEIDTATWKAEARRLNVTLRGIKKVDYVEKAIKDKGIGRCGENWLYDYEVRRLQSIGNDDLAKKVRWISREEGDGLGYDILSYDNYGNEIFIEVKTTTGDLSSPFYISENERVCSSKNPKKYALYRLYNYNPESDMYDIEIFRGDLTEKLCINARSYEVRL